MLNVPERKIANLMTRDAAFDAVEGVFAAMASKDEVEAALLARATVFTDEVAQSISIGEAQHAIDQGLMKEGDVHQLGAVINGTHTGRTSEDEITLFHGNGVGLQDLAEAAAVVDLAVARGVAIDVDF